MRVHVLCCWCGLCVGQWGVRREWREASSVCSAIWMVVRDYIISSCATGIQIMAHTCMSWFEDSSQYRVTTDIAAYKHQGYLHMIVRVHMNGFY